MAERDVQQKQVVLHGPIGRRSQEVILLSLCPLNSFEDSGARPAGSCFGPILVYVSTRMDAQVWVAFL